MDTMLYRVNIDALKLYLSITGLTIIMIVFPFLRDLSQCDYVGFPFTSLLSWITQGDSALIEGLIKTIMYLGSGMSVIHYAHGKNKSLLVILPVVLELLLYYMDARMINIDEIVIIESGMIGMIGYHQVHKVVKP